MPNRLKSFNVFGVVTVFPGRVIALAVSVLPDRNSIERTASRELPAIPGLAGTHQILFGALIWKGMKPEIAVFQLEPGDCAAPDLVNHPAIQAVLSDVVGKVQEAMN